MFPKMLIRKKILYSTLLLTLTLLPLLYCSLRGVYAYRNVAINLQNLSNEIRQVWSLQERLTELREVLSPRTFDSLSIQPKARSVKAAPFEFLGKLDFLKTELERHRERVIRQSLAPDPLLETTPLELETVDGMIARLRAVENEMLTFHSDPSDRIDAELAQMSSDLRFLFNFLTDRMDTFRNEIRSRYRSWIAVIICCALASLVNLAISFWFFRRSVVQPFKQLLRESAEIADGNFNHRIQLGSQDELAELAHALNSMTDRFVEVRDNLNQQVRQRTQEVVRSEQLASVGFLAAGVAHEINNPITAIAWSAEALEGRLHEILNYVEEEQSNLSGESSVSERPSFDPDQIEILRSYLKKIQEEGFRCKKITGQLLDFSRLGESQKREETDIHQTVSDVIELVKHRGEYRNRPIHFRGTPGIYAFVSPTEVRQVVLNLLTNALDASDDGDETVVTLEACGDNFELTVVDQGCGMTGEVIDNLFEPFFTRRRDGRGTGLGLSITYRIVQDHAGELQASSAGSGFGSTLKLKLPINAIEATEYERLSKAA